MSSMKTKRRRYEKISAALWPMLESIHRVISSLESNFHDGCLPLAILQTVSMKMASALLRTEEIKSRICVIRW